MFENAINRSVQSYLYVFDGIEDTILVDLADRLLEGSKQLCSDLHAMQAMASLRDHRVC